MANKLYKATISFDIVVASEIIPSKQHIISQLENIVGNEPDSIYNIDINKINELHELPSGWQPDCVPYLTKDCRQISTYFED